MMPDPGREWWQRFFWIGVIGFGMFMVLMKWFGIAQ